MKKQRVFLTGATGVMGFHGLKELLKDDENQEVVILVRYSEKNKKMLEPFKENKSLTIHWGDLTDYDDVFQCVDKADIILHVAAFVSPAADYYPKEAMKINYGSTRNILRAIKEQDKEEDIRLVYIGTVAQTGDRMPPIHWGRVGDPIKPSIFDYYAVSKVAAERLVIESGLKYWVSLRQTGIIGRKMSEIEDTIIFHNCLDNVLEYVSDRDSATLLRNLCKKNYTGTLGTTFWQHIYNIGGGKSCRISAYNMFKELFGALGIKDLAFVLDSKWFATRNFHGQYYLDSDKLNDILNFRSDSIQYFYDAYLKSRRNEAVISRFLTKIPMGQKFLGNAVKSRFHKLAKKENGTVTFVENNRDDYVAAYWGSKKAWAAIPPINEIEHFEDWDKVVHIDHGFDETKPESALTIEDVKGAALFRGGICLSSGMEQGNWAVSLKFLCAFGHEFDASSRLVLEGGHWCPVCERESWNYHNRAQADPYFAQVWDPLHEKDEETRIYKKIVTELDV